jgi:hypothetical protein
MRKTSHEEVVAEHGQADVICVVSLGLYKVKSSLIAIHSSLKSWKRIPAPGKEHREKL